MEKVLPGDPISLRPLKLYDMRKRAVWTADEELSALMGADRTENPFESPQQEEQLNRDWLEHRQRAGDWLYAIEAEGRYIGDIDLVIFSDERKAEMTVFIGAPFDRGRGYGTEAVRLMIAELRAHQDVDRIEVDVPAGNARSLAFWEKLGFQQYKTDDEDRRWLQLSLKHNEAIPR